MPFRNVKIMPVEISNKVKIAWLCCKNVDDSA
jgi:hypothetical protein